MLAYRKALAKTPTAHPKGLKSAIILITWELWKERNVWVFNNNKFTMLSALLDKIKVEGKNWILAGAKHFGVIVS